jgi:hypothetical protein
MKIAALIVSALIAASTMAGAPAHAVSLGQACGGTAGSTCDKGLWCEPPPGACSAAQEGMCVAIPRLCIARKRSKSFRPVCGCNSKTYSSDCFRRAYKIGKSHDGKCEPASSSRGG